MAQVENLFALLDGEEDASKIIEAAMAAKGAEKAAAASQDKKQHKKAETKEKGTVWNPKMMRAKRIILPRHVLRSSIVFRKEKEQQTEGKGSVGDDKEQNENDNSSATEHPVSNENAIGYKEDNRYKGNNGYSNGYQGNFRSGNNNKRYYGVAPGYQGSSRGANQYRNNRYNNEMQGNHGGINGHKMGNEADSSQCDDNDGWIYVGHRGRFASGTQSQGSGTQQQVSEVQHEKRASGNNFDGGDRKGRHSEGYPSYRGKGGRFGNKHNGSDNRSNNGRAGESSGREEASVLQAADCENNGDGVDRRDLGTDGADTAKCSSGVEGHKDSNYSKKSGKNGHEVQDNSKMKQDDDENKMTLKEYEKVQLQKRKTSDSLKNTAQRKVIIDTDFKSMQLLEKKNQDDLTVKLNSDEKDPSKKKDSSKEEKIRKSMSINEFLKPADGQRPGQGHLRERSFRGRNGEGPFQGLKFNGERPNGSHKGNNSDRFRSRPVREGGKFNGGNTNGFVNKPCNDGMERKRHSDIGERPRAGHGIGSTHASVPIVNDPNQFPALGRGVSNTLKT